MAKQTEVYELCSLEDYDSEQAKLRSSLSWLIAKAYPQGAPAKLQTLFLTDPDGVWYLRPAVIDSLVSCELYVAACNTLFGTSDRRFRDFDAVLGYLRDAGISLAYGDDGELSSELLQANAGENQEDGFEVYAHVTLCDAIMQAYANDLVKLDFMLETIAKYAPTGAEQPPIAASFDEALVMWLNSVCSQCDLELEKLAQLDAAFHYDVPQLSNVNEDLSDGRTLCLILFFYAPVGFVRVDDLSFQQTLSLADSVHNLVSFLRIYETVLQKLTAAMNAVSPSGSTESTAANSFGDVLARLTPAQSELLRSLRCYLTVEDLLYSVRSVELNSIVFLLELFYVCECVLNGSIAQPDVGSSATMTGSAFVPALETVVEADSELPDPDSDPNNTTRSAPNDSLGNEADGSAKENISTEEEDDTTGHFGLGTTNRNVYRTYTKDSAKRAEAVLVSKRSDSGNQASEVRDPIVQDSKTATRSVNLSASDQPTEMNLTVTSGVQGDGSPRITFGMLRCKPTPLLSPNSLAANNVSSAAPASARVDARVESEATPQSVASPSASAGNLSLKEQFLKSKQAKREQTLADANAKVPSANVRDANAAQKTTWANLKRRSNTDLDMASVTRASDAKSTSGFVPISPAADRMTQSVVGLSSVPRSPHATLMNASGSELSLSNAKRVTPVRMASGGDSSSSPSTPDLTALHMRFEQKKRAIETERARMLDDLARQRQAVTNQAFVHVLNMRRARGNDSSTVADPPNLAQVQQATVASAPATASPSASQRTRGANLGPPVTQQSTDEQLRFLEKVDDDLTQYQAEIDRLQHRRTVASPSNTNAVTANATVGDSPSPLPHSAAPWQALRVDAETEPRIDQSLSSYSVRSAATATGERSTSMFFLNEKVDSGSSSSSNTLIQSDLAAGRPRGTTQPYSPPAAAVEPLRVSTEYFAPPKTAEKDLDSRVVADRHEIQTTNGGQNDPHSASSTPRPDQGAFVIALTSPNHNGDASRRSDDGPSEFHLAEPAQAEEEDADSAGLNASAGGKQAQSAVGFVVIDDSGQDASELEDRRRRRLLETAARRAEEAAARQREREAEAAARELARAQRADENDRRKQTERARREAIFRGYVERKQSEATGPPYGVSNYASNTAPSASRTARTTPNSTSRTQQPAADGSSARRASSMRRKVRDERAKSAFLITNGDDEFDSSAIPLTMTNSSVDRSSTSASQNDELGTGVGTTPRNSRSANANSNANAVVNPSVNANTNAAFARASSATRSFRTAPPPPRGGATGARTDADLGNQSGSNIQYVLANADVNASANAGNNESDPQTKLFVKPKAKSNRSVIMNAVAYACLAGSVNEALKRTVLDEIERSNASHFVILLRDSGTSQFKAVFEFDEERDRLTRLVGVGPRQLTSAMVEKFFKFNSGTKSFSEVTSTRHVSTVIDAVTMFERCWQMLKKSGQPTSISNPSANMVDTSKAHPNAATRPPAGSNERVVVAQQSATPSRTAGLPGIGDRRGVSPAPPSFAAAAAARSTRKH